MKRLVLAIILLSISAQAQRRPEIHFESQVEVTRRDPIVLGDIIQIKNPTEALVAAAEKFKIEEPVLTAGLNPQNIRAIYKNLVSENPSIADANPKLVVPSKIEVRVIKGFSESQFRRKLVNFMSAQCSPCEVTIDKATFPQNGISSEGNVIWGDIKLAQSVLIPLSAEAKGSEGLPQTQWVSAVFKIKKNALVAMRNINFGERIGPNDFELKWVDVSTAKEEPLTEEGLKPFQLYAKPIQRGRIIFASDLKKELAAIRGQNIKAIAGDEGFEVTLTATAEENGQVGDLIKIKNADTKKILSAVVIEKGVVKIQ